MNDELKKFRMEIRINQDQFANDLDDIDPYIGNNFRGEEEEEEEANITDRKFYEHLSNLLDKQAPEEIRYFLDFFHLDSDEPLLEAISSMPNFLEFLKEMLFSPNKFARFNTLQVIMIVTYCNIDYSALTDPEILEFLLAKLNNDFFDYRLISLKVIINIIVQYNEVYEFFSQNNFAEQLKLVANFRHYENDSLYKQKYNRKSRIIDEISYAIYVIVKPYEGNTLFKPEEAPILWDTAIFLFSEGCETKAFSRITGILGLLSKSGFLGEFPENLMDEYAGIPLFTVDDLKSFRFLLQNLPDPEEFFTSLLELDIMDNVVKCIEEMDANLNSYNRNLDKQDEIQERVKFIYLILGDLKFSIEDTDFILLSLEKLKGPYKIYTKDSIIYYLTSILNAKNKDLIHELIDQDIFLVVDDFLSFEEESIVQTCLNFFEQLLNCYSEAFQKEPSSFPSSDSIENSLDDLITRFNDEMDEQIERINELLRPAE